MEAWYTELLEENDLLDTTPFETSYTVPTELIADNCVWVACTSDAQGHLPMRGHLQHNTEETYHVPLGTTDLDDTYGLDFDEHGQYVKLCFTTDWSKEVRSEH